MATRRAAWNWRDVSAATGATGRTAPATKRAKAKPAKQAPVAEAPSSTAGKLRKAKPVKGKMTAQQPAPIADVQVEQPTSALAVLAKIAEAQRWTLDQALEQAVHALNRRLYGKAAASKAR